MQGLMSATDIVQHWTTPVQMTKTENIINKLVGMHFICRLIYQLLRQKLSITCDFRVVEIKLYCQRRALLQRHLIGIVVATAIINDIAMYTGSALCIIC